MVGTVLSAWAWIGLAESRPGIWVLGTYRMGSFLLSIALTYATLLAAILVLFRLRKKAILRVALVHLGIMVAVVLVEVLSLFGQINAPRLIRGERRSPSREMRLRFVSDPGSVWEGYAYPDLHHLLGAPAEPIHASVRKDRYGLRNPEGKVDPVVFCIGDSILEANLVPIEETLTERLQRLVGLETLNVSESGYSPQEALIRLGTVVGNYKGKLVLQFIFEGNDLSDSVQWREWCASRFWRGDSFVRAVLQELRWPKRPDSGLRFGRFKDAEGRLQDVYFGYWHVPHLEECPSICSFMLKARTDIVESGGGYAVVFVPITLRVLRSLCEWPPDDPFAAIGPKPNLFAQCVGDFCEENKIPFLDLTPFLQREAETGRLPYFTNDTHLNSLGHEVVATAIAPWVASLFEELHQPSFTR